MIRRPPRSTLDRSSAASDVYKRQDDHRVPSVLKSMEDKINGIQGYQFISNSNLNQNPCLLYTSPSPRDRTRYRMPSSA